MDTKTKENGKIRQQIVRMPGAWAISLQPPEILGRLTAPVAGNCVRPLAGCAAEHYGRDQGNHGDFEANLQRVMRLKPGRPAREQADPPKG